MAYSYDSVAARYRDTASGRFIPESQVRAAVDAVVKAGTDHVVALTRQLQAGTLDLATWESQMLAALKVEHVAVGMAAKGGSAQVSPADYGALGQRLREQYGFLRQFAADVASGKQALDGRLLIRAELYGQAARQTYSEVQRREGRLRGNTEERRVRASTDSCSGCVEQAARGWQPVGVLLPLGSQPCRSRCRCHFEQRRAQRAA